MVGTEVQGNEPFSVMTTETNSCGVKSYKRSSTFKLGFSELSMVFRLPRELKKLLSSPRRKEDMRMRREHGAFHLPNSLWTKQSVWTLSENL